MACCASIDDMAAQLSPDDPQSARVKALTVFGMMVGTMQLSRALADRRLADAILEQGVQNVLALLCSARPPRTRIQLAKLPATVRTPARQQNQQAESQVPQPRQRRGAGDRDGHDYHGIQRR